MDCQTEERIMSTSLIYIQDDYEYLCELNADLMKDVSTVKSCGQAILSGQMNSSTIDSYKDLVTGTLERCSEARNEMDEFIKCDEINSLLHQDELTREECRMESDSKKSMFEVPQGVHDEKQLNIDAQKTIYNVLIDCSGARTKVKILQKKLYNIVETLKKYFHYGRSNSYGGITMLRSEIQKLNDFSPSHTQQAHPGNPPSDQQMRGSQEFNSPPLYQQQYAPHPYGNFQS